MKNKPQNILVILMTYGSPRTLNEVPRYLKNVYRGKDPSAETVKEFRRRYKLIGGSPLIKITQEQAKALEKNLNSKAELNTKFKVVAGMRFSKPFIEDVIKKFAKNVDFVVGIIMSPQYSPIIMSGYVNELTDAVKKLKGPVKLKIATDWHREALFLKGLSERVNQALNEYPSKIRKSVKVLFSAHSMPKKVVDREPNYIRDLKDTARGVAKLSKLSNSDWMFCYQSAGHTPEKWLKPDFSDIMPKLYEKSEKDVLIAPVQFLADHLEILYDVEIGAREQAEKYGINFKRTKSLNTSPTFIKALASVVLKQMGTGK